MSPAELTTFITAYGPAGTMAAFVWCAVEIKHLRKSVDKAHERIDDMKNTN